LPSQTPGYSLAPLRAFLPDCKKHHDASVTNTLIYYDRTALTAHWATAAKEPLRSLSTIDLDETLKTALVADIAEYLNPARVLVCDPRVSIPKRLFVP
jgi:hypothetical protein